MVMVLIVDDSTLARMAVNKALQHLYLAWMRVETASVEAALNLHKERARTSRR